MTLPDSVNLALNQLRNDSESGASELVNNAIEIIKRLLKESSSDTDLKPLFMELFDQIIKSRPSMAPLIHTIGYLYDNLLDYTSASIYSTIIKFYQYQSEIKAKLEQTFDVFISNLDIPNPKIMLISYSSTIINLIKKQKDVDFIFYILESRPIFEGRKSAEILADKYETHLIVDAALGKFINEIDMVFIGIDSILNDGSIINKIGSYPLSVLAKSNGKAVYAIGDSFKYNLRSHFGLKIEIDKKPVKEIIDKKTHKYVIENYYFDRTPVNYIDKIISDLGILIPKRFLDKVQKNVPLDWFKNFI